jgi:Iron-containing redox enzyme
MTNVHLEILDRQCRALLHRVDAHPLLGAVVRGGASRDEYIRFLSATYHYVRWSGPLLAASAAGVCRRGRYPWLVALLEQKTQEEAPHDRWALSDLRRCGANVELLKVAPPRVAVQAYVDWSLAMAEDGSPAFLGSAYALEFVSMLRAQSAADNLRARAAIPDIDRAVLFLTGHGGADVAHVARLGEVLTRVDDPDDVEDILLAATMMCRLYPRFFGPSATAPLTYPAMAVEAA